MKKTRLTIIAAMARNRVIGKDNRLPWYLPADLQHFKKITMGKPMIMGRRTWESLPGLLPGRRHIVITRDLAYKADGAEVAHSLEQAIQLAGDVEESMLVGGANLYAQALDIADRMQLTEIDLDVDGDAWFPEFDRSVWREVERQKHERDEKNQSSYSFVTLEK